MRIEFNAGVIDSAGQGVGNLTALVFDRESRRVAGFLVRAGETAPRDLFVMPGQVAQIEQHQITLTLSGDAVEQLPDARQHLYVAPGQDVDEEIATAEEDDLPDTPDPDEAPTPTTIPGFPLLPGFSTPLEIERTAMGDDRVTLSAGLRVLTADGEALGQATAVEIEDAQLLNLIVAGDEPLAVGHNWLDQLDEDAGELRLVANSATLDTTELPATSDERDGGEGS